MPLESTSHQHVKDGSCVSPLDASVRGTPAMDCLRRSAFSALRSAIAPTLTELAAATGQDTVVIRELLAELITAGLADIDGDLDGDPRVVGAEGLTVKPTPHQLTLSAETLYTWCAVDTVGIPAALYADAVATTTCPACGNTIELEIRQGRPPVSRVLAWWPAATAGPVNETFCPTALFFCGESHLDDWLRTQQAGDGEPVSLEALAERGRWVWALFGNRSTQGARS